MKNVTFFLLITLLSYGAAIAQSDTLSTVNIRHRSVEVEEIHGVKELNGITLYKEKLSQILMAFKNKQVLWKADVISTCGKPFVGKSEIRNVENIKGKLLIIYGKHDYAEIDLLTGDIKCLGSD